MMTAKLDEQAIFNVARRIETPEARQEYLHESCGGDRELQARVEALLRVYDEEQGFLQFPAQGLHATIDQPIAERPGTVIGPYKLLEQIGEGGFGIVFMAEQTQPVRRKVALKVLKPGMDTRQVVARFEAERQALALMDHPNIAKVLDGGTVGQAFQPDVHPASQAGKPDLPSGRPYFVMELVRGVPITEFCDQRRLAIPERLRLFVDVCQAVQHAHQKGIIHRDIKPSNVMLTLYDGQPVVKVIDFGVAKALGQQLTEKTLFTNFAQLIGTPLYMPPEQAELSGRDVDTRGDIYSLGVLLYELLTGTTPFEKERLSKVGYDELRRIIREEEPPKPSDRMSTVGKAATTACEQRQTDPRKLRRLFHGDLDWVVMKALEKDRDRRYETAGAFAADIERYLHNETVLACPPSAWYRFRKLARRKKTTLGVAAGVLLVMSATAGSLGWAVRDQAARDQRAADDQSARDAALDAEVRRALDETGPLIDASNWQAALAAVERAGKLLSAAGRSERPARLGELEKELSIALRLEETYLEPRIGPNVDTTVAQEALVWYREQDAVFSKLFAELDIDVEALETGEAAARVRGKSIRLALFSALDEWAMLRRRAHGAESPGWKKLVEIAVAADDNLWRRQFRGALLKRDRQALEELADAAPLGELAPATACLLGKCLHELESSDKALAVLRAAERQHPDDFWLNSDLGWLNTVAVQPPRYDEAVRYHSAALAAWPRHTMTHVALADILLKKGDVDEGLSTYARAIEIGPQDANLRHKRALAFEWLGKRSEALADVSQAIALEPNAARHWACRGNLYANLRQYENAIADYSKAGELEPFPYGVHTYLARHFIATGRCRDGLSFYGQRIERQPKEFGAWLARGEFYARLGLYDLAGADFAKAFEFQPPASPWGLDTWHCHALLRVYLGDTEGYRKVATKLPQHFQQSAFDFYQANVLARALALAPDPEIDLAWAAEQAEFAAKTNALPCGHNSLGMVHYRAGRYEQALRPLREAIRLDSHWPPAITSHSVLAMAYHGLGQAAEARQALIEADQKVDECQQALLALPPQPPSGDFWGDVLEGSRPICETGAAAIFDFR